MRRVLAVLALAVMLVAPPILLLTWGFTDWGSIRLWRITDVRVVLAVLTVLGWTAWTVWTLSVVIEGVAALSGRSLVRRLPGLSWSRALASGLIAAALASAGPVPAHASSPGAAASSVMTVEAGRGGLAMETPGSLGDDHTAGDHPDGETSLALAAPVPGEGIQHTVRPGDDLWTLAEHYLGDGGRWRSIVAVNESLQADPLARPVAGTVLRIPEPAISITVERGDTLSALAREHLGDARRWPQIHRENAERIQDPDLIRPGWVLKLPSAVQAPEAEASDAADGGAPTTVEPAATIEDPVPATATSASVTSSPAPVDAQERRDDRAEVAPVAALVGGMGALTAAAVLGGIGIRRGLRSRVRPVGRRYASPAGEVARYETALARRAFEGDPGGPLPARDDAPAERTGEDRIHLIDKAMRLLGAHATECGEPAPPLHRVLVGRDDLEFQYEATPTFVPDGFVAVGDSLVITWAALRPRATPERPVAYPALVTLGELADGLMVMIDVLNSGVLGVRGDEASAPQEVLSAMMVELTCAPWASDLDLLVVTDDPAFARVAGEEQVVCADDVEASVARVERLVQQRSLHLAGDDWEVRRLDPDATDAWTPQVFLFELAPDATQLARLEAAIDGCPCGVAAIVPVGEHASASADWILTVDESGVRRVDHEDARAIPQTVPAETRTALSELHLLATTTATTPAPWWPAPTEDDVNIIALRPAPAPVSGPRLNLLGPVELTGCTGTPPTRAVRQCLEYCAWLLLNPGGTAVQMTHALLIADPTRRSNMSRLRTWLGSDAEGGLHLPDAYSGRIHLHPDVTSDWRELLLLTEGGVQSMPLDRLIAALELVRGAPLADAAPSQWGWAEEFRSDASALIRDIGLVAAERARQLGDLDTSRWAANRALVASPEDELLFAERIRTEHAAGRTDEVERLVRHVTRITRLLDVDLLPETVDLCQEVIEGRRRARA